MNRADILAEMKANSHDRRHGTSGGYSYGCRCDKCRIAFKKDEAKSRNKTFEEMQADPNDRRHGTAYGYNCGCRCERCKEAIKRAGKIKQEKVLAKMQENPNDEHHGTIYGYRCGCRCEKCSEAGRLYRKRYEMTDNGRAKNKSAQIRSKAKVFQSLKADPNDKRHGTVYGYGCGCRCGRCKEAWKNYHRNHRRKQHGKD